MNSVVDSVVPVSVVSPDSVVSVVPGSVVSVVPDTVVSVAPDSVVPVVPDSIVSVVPDCVVSLLPTSVASVEPLTSVVDISVPLVAPLSEDSSVGVDPVNDSVVDVGLNSVDPLASVDSLVSVEPYNINLLIPNIL